jgi:hypothetical protein
MMQKQVRRHIVQTLWDRYLRSSSQAARIHAGLKQKGLQNITLDHFAIIDLPGPHTGIRHLSALFSQLGYSVQGQGYLPDKQNDFIWLMETDSPQKLAHDALPQVVVADFRLDEMPPAVRSIISNYASLAPRSPLDDVQILTESLASGDTNAATALQERMLRYLSGRDWPLPTVQEFHTVQSFNQLLAWVLVFGRIPNHFTLSVHLLRHFADLPDFHRFIEGELELVLNSEGGIIKGGEAKGIAQSSTLAPETRVNLRDGDITLPTAFVEFVWRYPKTAQDQTPLYWKDYFTGFIAQHADHVIESLYI